MKKILLPVLALCTAGAYGQTYFSDDFASGLGSWTLIDADGDGNEWNISNAAAYGSAVPFDGDFAQARSWTGADGALNPDNYMVSTAGISIPGAAGNCVLSWTTGTIQGAPFHEENYSVLVATGTDVASLLAADEVFTETLADDQEVLNRSVDLSAYIGSTIYIAFRHHSCTNMNMLVVDDVTVATLPDYDISVNSLNLQTFVEAGMVNIEGEVKNNGAMTITSFDLTWDDGTGPNTETISTSIASGGTYTFTHTDQLNAVGGTAYSVEVCADLVDDAEPANDCMTGNVNTVTEVPEKHTVGEEKTGTWCGWCPRGAVALEDMESTSTFHGVAVHNGDPMVVASYDGAIGTYVPGGYPGAGVDRVLAGDPTNFSAMHSARVNTISPASITAEYEEVGGNMEVTITADIVGPWNGDYRLGAIVVEDNVTGTSSGYAQANYYDGGGAGPLDGAGHDWTTAGNPVPAADMEYDHVARALGDNQILGASGSLPTVGVAGTTESHTYTIAIGSDWDMANVHVIGILVDGSTGEILNAGSDAHAAVDGIEEVSAENFNVSVFPNPSADMTNIKVSLEEASNVTVEIYNLLGEMVYSSNTDNLSAGEYFYQVDVADYSAGIYTVKTTVNNESKTTKLSVK